MVTTIQGNTYFFCCWKMGNKYNLRLVILQAESIFYMENDLPIVTELLRYNLERLQIKNFIVEQITGKPYNGKASKKINATVFRSDAKHNEGYAAIL
jgi:hypothetical protein